MKLAAIFIETRVGQQYVDVINQHMKHLPGWDLCIITSYKSAEFYLTKFKCKYLLIDDIRNMNEYNQMLTSDWFWEQFVGYNKCLIFQHDSGILRNNIDDFLEYDYVGAPWTFQEHGGNGGLSLRNPYCMQNICRDFPYNPTMGNEDVYFCNVMHNGGYGKLAPREVCSKFSVEVIYQEDTFGYHAIDKYHNEEIVNKIKSQEE